MRITNARLPGAAARELVIHAGRVATSLPPGIACETLDARGQFVLPAAIDMHTHVLSRGPAIAREAFADHAPLVPTPDAGARDYLRLGYGLFVDAAMPPDELHDARQARAGAAGGWLLELGTQPELARLVASADEQALARWLSEQLAASGALGVKLVVPATASLAGERETITRLGRALAHLPPGPRLHLHAPALGQPGSADATVKLIHALDGLPIHLAHVQFYAYGRSPRGQHTSGTEPVADALARARTISADVGCISFGKAMMVSRDHALAAQLGRLLDTQPVTREGWSVMPLSYRHDNPVHAVQWATGLELILRSPRLDRLALTVDHPNGGPFRNLPALLGLLMHRDARQAALQQAHPAARQRTGLGELDRELTIDEALAITRTAPAAALGVRDRGRLDRGAVGDVVITEDVTARPSVVVQAGRVVIG
ncbi:MAG: amidohydrolase family protein [Phycisphaeraceae bacterium]